MFLLLIFVLSALAADELQKYSIHDAAKKKAVCNDGTGGVYWARFNESSTDWMVFLQGGGGCYSEESCQDRWENAKDLMTSTTAPDTIKIGGILSDDCATNPSFCTANMVLVHYCSSDWWSGNASKSADSEFMFYGRNVVSAALDDLVNYQGLKNGKTFVLSGGSAGGVGCFTNSDAVGSQVKQLVGKSVEYSIISDSGFFLDGPGKEDWPCTDNFNCNFEHRLRSGQKMWGLTGHKKCMDHFLKDDEQWKCLVGHYLYPFIESRKMAFFYLFDLWQAFQDHISKGTIDEMTDEEKEWVFNRGKEVYQYALKDDVVGWVQGCYHHTVVGSTEFFTNTFTNDGMSPKMTVEKFMKGENPKSVDICLEIKCNSHCP